MNDRPKVIANYLPQYHRIPENDRWWGEGYTDWEAVKRAKPLYSDHDQPRVPENDNYYSLDDVESLRWQATLAKTHGVYGFGIYHYWFSSKMQLLEKPAELILENPDIDINFMFLWDNDTWKRTWSAVSKGNDWAPTFDAAVDDRPSDESEGILAKLEYGTEVEWKAHFDYLLPFFKDPRYIKKDGRPLFGFMRPRNDFEVIDRMTDYWNELAQEQGFEGVLCMTNDTFPSRRSKCELDWKFRYAPLQNQDHLSWLLNKAKTMWARRGHIRFEDYDEVWKLLLRFAKKADDHTYLSGFVSYDDTPRRGEKGMVIRGGSPRKFQHYLTELLELSRWQGKEYVFLSAWNEWGEGMYLEPDTVSGDSYLRALLAAIEAVGRNW